MAFFSTLISTVLKMLFIGVFAVGGVFAGKKLRKRKEAKNRRKCGSFLNSIILTSHQNLFIIRI